ncbi:MAG TPA: sodium:calcium antiporter [Chitinophagaceae bacterium]|nr:sodium:calcium antiporter [Chitinophagaceae bacterium]
MPLFSLLVLAIALIGLWIGTRLSVNNAIKVAKHYGFSEFFIGLTIVSIGTDLPEMVVAVTAAIHKLNGQETSGLIIGNAIGSCLGQMGFVLGLSGLFYRLTINRKDGIRDGLVMGIATFVLMVLASDGFISRIEGVLLVVIFMVYLSVLLSQEKSKDSAKEKIASSQLIWVVIQLFIGLAIVIYSSEWTIRKALDIATYYNIKQSIVGIFIIGLGTSLPEAAVSIGGIFKGSVGLSGGTVIGSTIFDILVPIGVGASISPLSFDIRIADFDIPAFLIIALLVFSFFITRKGVSKFESLIILGLFFLYAWLKLTQ